MEQEAEFVLAGVDGSDSGPKRTDKFRHAREERVGQHRAFQMAPQAFNQIQIGTVWRKPVDLDPPPVSVQPVEDGSSLVVSGVVADQSDLATRVDPKQSHQECNEFPTALFGRVGRRDAAGRIVDAAVDDALFVFPGRRHPWLMTDSGPHPRQMRVGVDFGFVGEDQGVGCVLAERFFFKTVSSFRARAWARSLRLPWSVCFGRWKENCS